MSSNRGGRRPFAGRPTKEVKRSVVKSARFTEEEWKSIEAAVGQDESVQDFIRNAILKEVTWRAARQHKRSNILISSLSTDK